MGEGVLREPQGGKGERRGFKDRRGHGHHLPLAKAHLPGSVARGALDLTPDPLPLAGREVAWGKSHSEPSRS